MSDDRDAALVRDCRAGDARAFERLLVRYERPVFNAAYGSSTIGKMPRT